MSHFELFSTVAFVVSVERPRTSPMRVALVDIVDAVSES